MRFSAPFEAELQALLDRCQEQDDEPRAALVPALKALQREVGFVGAAELDELAGRLGIPANDAANIAQYFEIRRSPPEARHRLEVCVNISCRRRGSAALLERCQERLGVDIGGVMEDRRVSLGEVVCLKLCEMGPNLRVDGESLIGVGLVEMDTILDRLLGEPRAR
jgi:NADH-quinone oxidoreductase subunit E